MSREPRLLTRVLKADDVPVMCGIGHDVRASVFTATYQHVDMDGDPLEPFTVEEYEPARCIVCGLLIWHVYNRRIPF
jgi:hypothetical protein